MTTCNLYYRRSSCPNTDCGITQARSCAPIFSSTARLSPPATRACPERSCASNPAASVYLTRLYTVLYRQVWNYCASQLVIALGSPAAPTAQKIHPRTSWTSGRASSQGHNFASMQCVDDYAEYHRNESGIETSALPRGWSCRRRGGLQLALWHGYTRLPQVNTRDWSSAKATLEKQCCTERRFRSRRASGTGRGTVICT